MILRDYRKEDANVIAGWLHSPEEMYKWSADRINRFPLSGDDIHRNYEPQLESGRFHPLVTLDDQERLVGHLIIRYPHEDNDRSVRFGFVLVNPAFRGKGYGKEMLRLAIAYARDHLSARRVELGVFDNNAPAKHCYESVGFRAYGARECELPIGTWVCTDMELFIAADNAE